MVQICRCVVYIDADSTPSESKFIFIWPLLVSFSSLGVSPASVASSVGRYNCGSRVK